MRFWKGLLVLCLATTASLFAYNPTESQFNPIPSPSSLPPGQAAPPINTPLAPNPKKVTRPKPGQIHTKYLAKPPAQVGLVKNQKVTETLTAVSPEILVDVQIYGGAGERFLLNEACLCEIIQHELTLFRIKSNQEAPTNGKEPNPHLQLEVFIQPVGNYYAVFMDACLSSNPPAPTASPSAQESSFRVSPGNGGKVSLQPTVSHHLHG